MQSSNNLGERIKMVREKAELSQSSFGKRVGLSQTAVTALENNQNEPRLSTFNQIVDAFQINSEWLRTGIGEMQGFSSAPAPVASVPVAAGPTSGEATVAESETLLKLAVAEARLEQVTQQLEEKKQENGWLREMLGKPLSSLEAALVRFMGASQLAGTVALT